MKKQAWENFSLAGISITEFGLLLPSPFNRLELNNSEISSFSSWNLQVTVGGDANKKSNIAAFESLLYTSAQAANAYPNSSGIPVSFAFGWLDTDGNIAEYTSYQGFTLQFKVTTSGLYLTYTLTGFASQTTQSSMPVLRIPEVSGIVQPSAIVEGLAKAVKADSYYNLDIDHNDAPTLVQHGAMNTSFNQYVRGSYSGTDDYDSFPGLLKLSKSYNGSRDSAGLIPGIKKLSQVMNNATVSPISKFLKKSLTDATPQCSSFSYWVDEPTMTSPGTIHYKSNAGLTISQIRDVLQYGTTDTNILSISGSYNGVAYNMTNMNFSSVGFMVDGSGNTVVQSEEVVNSWSHSMADVYQTVNIINDINAIASQFSADFTVTIVGSTRKYTIAQPVSLVIMSGNTLSPVSGIYNIISVSHSVADTFITTLKLQRLVISSANQVASAQGIFVSGTRGYPSSAFTTTSNIKSQYKVDFGIMYPTYEHMQSEVS